MREVEAMRTAATQLDPLLFRTILRIGDTDLVRNLAVATGFFSQAEVGVSVELVEVALRDGAASGYSFLFAQCGEHTCGYTCFGPVPCTADSFDLYWIVVDSSFQGQGIGRRLLTQTEQIIHDTGGRRVYAETSSRAQYRPTRAFYRHTGFRQVARLKDFYSTGDNKIIFCKTLH
jgi:ribosomal protein S18 acetylase RimI-like enzyme